MQKEEWKAIKGYEGYYEISNLGRVKSVERVVTNNQNGGVRVVPEKILRSTDNGNGYKIVGLRKKQKRKNFYIHRLVAEHFTENPEKHNCVNHKNFKKYDNTAENLEWCTQKENIYHSIPNMRKPHSSTKSKTGHKYIYVKNGKYRVSIPNYKEKKFNSIEEALKYKELIMNAKKK